MKKAIIITTIVAAGFNLYAQNTLDKVLNEVERNNTTLSAHRQSIDAEKIGNKTGLYPQNPEAEFNYLWGNPSVIGNRTDFSIKQSFDFPTAYSYQSQISGLKSEQAELEYKKHHNEILNHTRVVCIKLAYHNALKAELDKRYAYARQIADAYDTKYRTGDISFLEFNKARVNLLNLTKELESNEIERNSLLSELTLLNGGNPISFSDSVISMQTVPVDFGQWYVQAELNNPLLQWVKQEVAISSKEVQLNTAKSMPRFYAGYMSEKVTGEHFQGITVGITVPLWENKNTTRYAKARTLAMQSVETDAKLQFYNGMKATHAKAIALQMSVSDYHSKLAAYSNNELLYKAFNKGEISLTELMVELSLYYESINKLLEMEMDLNLAFAELYRYQ